MILDLSNYFTNGDKWLHSQLSELKQDPFPNDYCLTILYSKDVFENDDSIGVALTKLQKFLTLLDFPNFFVTVETSYANVPQDLKKLKELFCPYELAINYKIVDLPFEKIKSTNDTFCVLPWIHVYVNPQGQLGPCCNFNEHFPIGHMSENKISDIVNGPAMMKVRRQLLSGQRPESCSACWAKEDKKLVSARQGANIRWEKYLHLAEQTNPDGSFPDFKLRYLDVRLSNVCNLKCRMCGGKFSSRIAQEESILYNDTRTIELKLSPDEIQGTLEFVEDNISNLENIYFAGGEPMLMPEHYQILDLLLKHQRTDIQIYYNTNLTVLKYKGLNVVDYWRKFSDIKVGASIDLIGSQAGYVRDGTDYDVLESNYELIKGHVTFTISSIVHMLNVFNLPQLQKHWITNKQLPATSLSFSALIYPANMTLQVLPTHYKQLATEHIKNHIMWLQQIDNSNALVSTWEEVLHYMNADDQSHLLRDFFRLNDDKDQYRNESFEEVFPEYKNLRSYV